MTTPRDRDLVLWSGETDTTAGWAALAAERAHAQLRIDGEPPGARLCLDFALAGHGSWAILRHEGSIVLPEHYVVVLDVDGDVPSLDLQVKLVDATGSNVWWWRRRTDDPSGGPRRLALRRAALEFAWGPASGGEPRDLGAVEIALAADHDLRGTIWIDGLRIEVRDPVTEPPAVHAVRASSNVPGHGPECVLVPGDTSSWRPEPDDERPWIEVDLGQRCEWGGLVVDLAGDDAAGLQLSESDDGAQWRPVVTEMLGRGKRRWLRTADTESRLARLALPPGGRLGVAHLQVAPLELAVSPVRHAAERARRAPRGRYPRHLLGEQAYWAVVGADGDERKGLLGEDGALEVDAESFSIEPFLWTDGRLITWADVERVQSLADGFLPVPSVAWRARDVGLRVTAFASGSPGTSLLVGRYEVSNATVSARDVRLFLALRPYQVNPAWQSLNLRGGFAPITWLETHGAVVRVNDARTVVAVTRPDGFGAAPSETGLDALARGALPAASSADDPVGLAEAAWCFDLHLDAGATAVVVAAVPLHEASPRPPAGLSAEDATAWVERALDASLAHWRARLARVPIELPPQAAALAESLRASLGWILVNREGPRIQPGPRCYRRSWIRDGALTGTALAEMGFADEARAFLRWYAPYQYDDGRVPCAVDHHGVDPVPEHDSHGQLVWAVIEVFRLTGDRAFLDELWPRVSRAVAAIAALRAQRTTAAYGGGASFGLLPESISHEGYSSRPVHSYWDDFFAVRALADAAWAAGVVGDTSAAGHIDSLCQTMRRDLHASIVRTIADHDLDVLPGSVELGDFDPTSSAIAFDPCDEAPRLPPDALARTFERYWDEITRRHEGRGPNDGYAPYEARNATALVRLGRRERALTQLTWLLADQRPQAWRQWPEIVWRDERAPRFLGDLPHGWVASTFVRAVRRLVVDERRDEGVLVLAAGVPEAWVSRAPGIRVRGLPTFTGALDFTMRAGPDDELLVQIGGAARPPGGFVVVSPSAKPLREVAVDGRGAPAAEPHRVTLAGPVRELRLRY